MRASAYVCSVDLVACCIFHFDLSCLRVLTGEGRDHSVVIMVGDATREDHLRAREPFQAAKVTYEGRTRAREGMSDCLCKGRLTESLISLKSR